MTSEPDSPIQTKFLHRNNPTRRILPSSDEELDQYSRSDEVIIHSDSSPARTYHGSSHIKVSGQSKKLNKAAWVAKSSHKV